MNNDIFYKTNFEKVLEFNKSFDVETYINPQLDVFKTKKKLVDYRLKLILEEVQELQDAIKNEDLVETIDALTDILYVTYGAFTAIGINADEAFSIVHESNMSKLCKTQQEAEETVKWYLENEKERYSSPEYHLKNGHYVVKNKSTSKVLKSINYIPAKFTELLIDYFL